MTTVRSKASIPIATDFVSGRGTPLVVNQSNGRGYVMLTDDTIVPVGGRDAYNVADYASFEAAVTAIGSSTTTLLIGTSQSVANNVTVPSTLTLWFLGSGQLNIASGKTVTINGPLISSPRQIFAGSGTVAGFGKVKALYPDWWTTNTTPGTTDMGTAIDAALTVLEANGTGTLTTLPTTYAYATSPNFARTGVSVVAAKGSLFTHTGTGNACTIDGGSGGGGLFRLRFENISVQGNTNSTHGFYVRGIHHSVFDHLRCLGCSTSGSAFQIEWCVANEWRTPVCSVNEGTLSPLPAHGMMLTRRGTGAEWTTTQTIINPVMEGLTGTGSAGLYCLYTLSNTILGGTSEGNYYGVYIASVSGQHSLYNLNVEGNTQRAVLIDGGNSNIVTGCYVNDGTIELASTANRNLIIGCVVDTLTLGASTTYNGSIGLRVLTAIADSNPTENWMLNCTDPGSTGAITPQSRILHGMVATVRALTYGTTVNVDARNGTYFTVTITDGVAFTLNNPDNSVNGQELTFTFRNTSGGAAGALTFGGSYKTQASWTQPATGFSRSITFYYNGTNWIEKFRSSADVAN